MLPESVMVRSTRGQVSFARFLAAYPVIVYCHRPSLSCHSSHQHGLSPEIGLLPTFRFAILWRCKGNKETFRLAVQFLLRCSH